MKKNIQVFRLCFLLLLGTNQLLAQAPNAISFQGIARNSAGNLIANQAVSLRFSIINTSIAGTTLYQETQSTTTNELGLFSVNIGTGTVVSGSMAAIDWKTNSKFLKVEIDPAGGSSYLNMGTQQFRSEAYALFANRSNNGISNGTNNYLIKSNGSGTTNSIVIDDGTNVGIGVSSPTAKLDIGTATNSTIKVSGLATTNTLTNDITNVAVMADVDGNLSRAGTTREPWYSTGNSVSAASNKIGTTSDQSINFITNNIVRGRLSNNGQFTWGTTTPVNAQDLVTVVSNPTNTTPISGYAISNGAAIWGETMAAGSSDHSSIEGTYNGSGTGSGIYGEYAGTNTSNTRAGVYGVTTTPTASASGIGVYGYNAIATGNQRIGVLGSYNESAFGFGVAGMAFGGGLPTGDIDAAIVGARQNNNDYSGYFNGNHVIANGTKSASVPTSKGNQLLYAIESPEVWFEDYGTATLVNGEVIVKLNPLFLETVAIDVTTHKMQVLIQMEDESEDVFVTKGTTDFKVKESNNGKSNATFSYKVIAKRLNFQDHRFGSDPVWQGVDNRKTAKYAPPPPIDYEENLKFQKQQALNSKENLVPPGFIAPTTPTGNSGSGENKKIK